MNQEKAREMAQAIISKVKEEIEKQKARVRTGVVPDLDRLTKAIQTYAVARYTTHPEVWPKGKYSYDYTEVVIDWTDQDWKVSVYRSSTVKTLWAEEKVLPIGDKGYLLRRTGEVELVERGMHLRRDPATGVYLPEGYCPPQEILQAATAGPFRVEVHRTVISLYPSQLPIVLRHKDPDKRVHLRYKHHSAAITPNSGELLSHLAMWRMME